MAARGLTRAIAIAGSVICSARGPRGNPHPWARDASTGLLMPPMAVPSPHVKGRGGKFAGIDPERRIHKMNYGGIGFLRLCRCLLARGGVARVATQTKGVS